MRKDRLNEEEFADQEIKKITDLFTLLMQIDQRLKKEGDKNDRHN